MEHATELDEKHSDMTACFGTLKNTSDKEIAVRSFAVPSLEGASTELHEVVDGIMRENRTASPLLRATRTSSSPAATT